MADKNPAKKSEKAQFPRELIVHFVDLMMAADHIVAEFKRRREDDGQEFMEELGFHERAQLASILMGLQMKDAMVDDAAVRRAAFERMQDLEKIREAEEKAAAAPQPTPMRLNPAEVERRFSQIAENNGVPNARARQFVKLLMGTPEGHEMLQIMVYEAVIQKRGQQGGKSGG